MIDMHSHILFGVDDGAKMIEESICMVELAVKEGITDVIATPHAFSPHFNVAKEEVIGQVRLLNAVIKEAGYPIDIHVGQEVRLHEHLMSNIEEEKAMTLAGSRYVLLELPSYSVPSYTTHIIQLLLSKGKIPIIAHPERNRAIAENPMRLVKLIRNGALAQVTAGSLSGHFGKSIQRLAVQLTEANLIHTYGSDTHNTTTRPLLFNKGLDYLEKRKLHDTMNILLENNERIIKDEPFIILEPESPILKKWWQLTS